MVLPFEQEHRLIGDRWLGSDIMRHRGTQLEGAGYSPEEVGIEEKLTLPFTVPCLQHSQPSGLMFLGFAFDLAAGLSVPPGPGERVKVSRLTFSFACRDKLSLNPVHKPKHRAIRLDSRQGFIGQSVYRASSCPLVLEGRL